MPCGIRGCTKQRRLLLEVFQAVIYPGFFFASKHLFLCSLKVFCNTLQHFVNPLEIQEYMEIVPKMKC